MIRFLLVFVAAFAGGLFGLGLTALSIQSPPEFGIVRAGPWKTPPGIGTAQADPYTRAGFAARGMLAMGAAEGLMLVASRDSSGAALSGRCTYRMTGPVPGSGFWTVTAYPDGGLSPTSIAKRVGMTSAEPLRFEGEALAVTLSPTPQPDNWIPLRSNGPFVLVLRIYDSQVNAYAIDAAGTPAIEREGCA